MWYGNLNKRKKQAAENSKHSLNNHRDETETIKLYIRGSAYGKKAVKIANDPSHPLNREFELLPSGRQYKSTKGKL